MIGELFREAVLAWMLVIQLILNLGEGKAKNPVNNKGKTSVNLEKQWHKLVWEFLGCECGRKIDYLCIKVQKVIWNLCQAGVWRRISQQTQSQNSIAKIISDLSNRKIRIHLQKRSSKKCCVLQLENYRAIVRISQFSYRKWICLKTNGKGPLSHINRKERRENKYKILCLKIK